MYKKIVTLKTIKKLFIACSALFIIVFNYQSRPITADSANALGSLSHYNAIIFGDMNATRADIEGALAVEKDIEFGSSTSGYDIGSAGISFNPYQMGQYKNPNHYPTLLLGGKATHAGVKHGKWINIYNGPAVVKNSYKEEFKNIPLMGFTEEVQGVEESDIREFFNSAKSTVENITNVLQKGNDKTISVKELQDLSKLTLSKYENKNINTAGTKTIVLNVDAYDSINIDDMNLPSDILDYDAIIINIPAESISFGLGEDGYIGALRLDGNIVDTEATVHDNPQKNLIVKQLAERIIWNFPNATSLSTYRYGVLGSVLAPNANLIGDAGSINGMVIAASFMQKGGMEPHAFPIRNIWQWSVDTSRVKIIKTTENGKTELPSELLSELKFTIRDASDKSVETLSVDNNFTSSRLAQGTYTIWEDTAPRNYQKLTEKTITFTVDGRGVITSWNGSDEVRFEKKDSFLIARINNELIPYIEQKPLQISINKIDADTKKSIPNVKFILEEENQTKWIEHTTLVSGVDGKSSGVELTKGSYRLKEVAPAQGYLGMSDYITFKVDSDLILNVINKPEEVTVQSTDSQTLFIIKNKLSNPNKPNKPNKPNNPNNPSNPREIKRPIKNLPDTGSNAQIVIVLLFLSLGIGTTVAVCIAQDDQDK